MKVLTFNIQHGVIYRDENRRIDLSGAAELINRLAPDIVSLNEVRGVGIAEGEDLSAQIKAPGRITDEEITADFADQTAVLSALTGMTGVFAPAISLGGTHLYGNALLTRYPVLGAEVLMIPSPPENERFYKSIHGYEHRCLLSAHLEAEGGKLTALVCHMGLPPDQRLDAVKAVCHVSDDTEGRKLLMGDFNMTPENELLLPIRERYDDTASYGADGATFPSDAPSRKIDYIFASGMRISRAEVLCDIVSDHRAILAEIY